MDKLLKYEDNTTDKLFKIGELANACNTTIKTIRYYEKKGLIFSANIDKNNGYHYYDFNTLVKLQKILKLKDLGFTLEEIKNYNKKSNLNKIKELENLLSETTYKKDKLISLEYTKRENLPYFINDEQALGLWKSIAFADSIDEYKKGNFETNVNQLRYKFLYFLNKGKDYGRIVLGWSKGKVNLFYNGICDYYIENNKLYLNLKNYFTKKHMYTMIYERIDNKKRDIAEPIFKDNTDLKFVEDKEVCGLWEIYDAVSKLDKDNYTPLNKKEDFTDCFYQSIIFKTDGLCIKEQFRKFIYQEYTKGKVLNKENNICEDYKIITFNNTKYLLIDTKNEDYPYANTFTYTYVFKKVN